MNAAETGLPIKAIIAGQPLVLRLRQPEDVVPDVSTEWDHWPDDSLPSPSHDAPVRLVIEWGDRIVGTMSWHATDYGPTRGSRAWNIGIALTPDARGQGIGSTAQRMLAQCLLTFSERVEASTDISNIAEQRALERAGFTREGVLRSAQHRGDGLHHDLVLYSLVRRDLHGGAPSTASRP